MSNTWQEFRHVEETSDSDISKNPSVVVVNGAQGTKSVLEWANPLDDAWITLEQRVTEKGLAPNQVQVLWMKHAFRDPYTIEGLDGPGSHIDALADGITQVIKIATQNYPNVKLIFLSNRIRSYLEDDSKSPEPFAFESAFAVRDVINRQWQPTSYDPLDQLPYPQFPLITWGPYLWADGENPRSDRLTYLSCDLMADCTHPSMAGEYKVATQIFGSFVSDPFFYPWFLKDHVNGPQTNVIVDNATGSAPLTIQLVATGATKYYWDFGDHTTGYVDDYQEPFIQSSNQIKTYSKPGSYQVTLVAQDDIGNSTIITIPVQVNSISGDLDTDGDVDILDYQIFLGYFSDPGGPADFNSSGLVDIFDFSILIGNFGS